MHVSVTALGSGATSAKSAARDIVDYLSGRSQQPGARKAEPVPERQTGPGSYYADSAELPGRWIGSGVETMIDPEHREHVDPAMLERVLLGQHPETGAQLVGARGSSGRTTRDSADQPPEIGQDPERLLTVHEVAHAAGVDESHIKRVLRRTEQLVAAADAAGETPELPKTYLSGTKVDRQWFITNREAERFMRHRSEPRVVLGYDLTFSVPKSVSVAWAASDKPGRAVIEDALHQAVDTSLRYVEETGIKVRVGRAQAKGDGMVAAAFLHDTSRELEPQLHVHVVVANMGTTAAGRVQALDGRGLFAHGTTAGHLAEAQIQSILNKRGYRFTETEKGIAHLEQIPQQAVDAFSTRRTQILAEVGALGVDSPAARQNAAYATRPAKVNGVDRAELEANWRDTLLANGMTPEQLRQATSHSAPLLWTPSDTERLDRHLASRDGVTRATSIFDRRDVIHAITDYSGGRLDAHQVQTHADRWLATDAVIPLRPMPGSIGHDFIGRSGRVVLAPGTIHYTTPQVVATEHAIREAYQIGLGRGTGVASQQSVDAAIHQWQSSTGHQLGGDQIGMIRSITTSGHQFQAVVGPAGSGKTAALEVAARAWETDGHTVIGASVNGNAAEVLARATGLETRTVASLIERLRYDQTIPPGPTSPPPLLSPTSVVLVDEASTLSNRDHAELLRHVTSAGATMRTIGDPNQHTSVEAGGAWAAAVERHPDTTPRLTENRRMQGAGMADVRLAADDYRNGQISQAIRRLDHNDRIITAATSSELLDTLAVDWFVDWRRHLARPTEVDASRMLAENHAIRRELNERAQLLLRQDGLIGAHGVTIGEATFHVGDQVVARQQDRNLRPAGSDRGTFVRNGTRGTVAAIVDEPGAGPSLIIDFDRRGRITVPNEFLTKRLRPGVVGGLAPAYAMTTHAAQGDTYDTSRAVLTDRSSAAGSYVALTRGRHDVRMYAVDANQFGPPNPAEEHNLPVSNDRRTLEDRIEAQLSKPLPTQLATQADPDLTKLEPYLRQPVHHLEQLEDPLATRVARIKLGRAQRQTIARVPDHLATIIRADSDTRHWRTAATRFAHYRERWRTDPLHQPPADGAPAGQRHEYQGLLDAMAEARAEQLGPLTPAEIAARRRQLPSLSRQRRSDPRTAHELQRRLAERHDTESRAVEHAARAYGNVRTPLRGRVDPDAIERQRRLLEQAQTDLSRTNAAIRDAQALAARRPTPTQQDRIRIEHRALQRLAQHHAHHTIANPPPYLTRLVGARPTRGDANEWLTAVRAVETYRITQLGLSPSDGPAATSGSALQRAIGNQPAQPGAAAHWARIRNLVANVPSMTRTGPNLRRS